MEETLTNANHSETVKIKTHHARIVVDGTADKPYYSIEWFDPDKKEYYLGYSSYYIGNVFNWLSECFEIIEATTTNADRIRAMSDEELAKYITNRTQYQPSPGSRKSYGGAYGNSYLEFHEAALDWLYWLQQPAKEDVHE